MRIRIRLNNIVYLYFILLSSWHLCFSADQGLVWTSIKKQLDPSPDPSHQKHGKYPSLEVMIVRIRLNNFIYLYYILLSYWHVFFSADQGLAEKQN